MEVFSFGQLTLLKDFYIESYLTYVKNSLLPNSLKELSIDGLRKVGTNDFYVMYPRLFMEPLGFSDENIVQDISFAGYFYYQSLMNIDRVYDYKGHSYNLFTMLSILNLQEESIKILTSTFPSYSEFWIMWNVRKNEFLSSLTDSKKRFSLKQFEKVSIAKASFAKIAIDSIFYLNRNADENIKKNYHLFLKSHDHFSVALQILDDVNDIAEDASNSQQNIAIEKLIEKSLINRSHIKTIPADDLKKLLHFSGISLILFRLAKHYLSLSLLELKNINDCYFKTILSIQIEKVSQKILSLKGILAIGEAKKKLLESDKYKHQPIISNSKDKLRCSVVNGLNYILNQKENNYIDLKHYMFLGKEENFKNKSNVHIGDVFQRAMILDILSDAGHFLGTDMTVEIEKEIKYLISKKNKDSISGWSYFQTVKEIAADADDLAQVMIALNNVNPMLVKQHCIKPLNILLKNNIRENGGIETWIIPRFGRTKKQQVQSFFNENNWGTGPDIEVNANILYALVIYDSKKYKEVIDKGVNFILSQENEMGLWKSRWYCGNKYATFMITRLFKALDDNMLTKKLQQTFETLLLSQNKDGGWGMGHKSDSDPLSTAFSLLILKLGDSKKYQPQLQSALNYLYKNQDKEIGNWQSVEFILPRLNNPYKSKTLTTAIVLKSMIA